MLSLILTIAVIGIIVWAVITYIPMPEPFKKAIIIITAICVLAFVLNAFGVIGRDIPVPQLH